MSQKHRLKDITFLLSRSTRSTDLTSLPSFNTLRPRQNGSHFADDIFKCIFLNENIWISIKISLKFVPKGPINNIPALDQIMAWRRLGDKPLSQPMMVILLTHICVTRPQWVKSLLGLSQTALIFYNMSVAWCKTAISPVHQWWRYYSSLHQAISITTVKCMKLFA